MTAGVYWWGVGGGADPLISAATGSLCSFGTLDVQVLLAGMGL